MKRPSTISVFLKTIVSGLARILVGKTENIPVRSFAKKPSSMFVQAEGETSPREMPLKEFEEIFNLHYTSVLSFESNYVREKIFNYCLNLDKSHAITQSAKWWGAYYKNELDSGFVAPVYIAWTGEEKHWGLFAREALPAGIFVAEYAGRVELVSAFFNNLTPYCFHYPLPLKYWLWFTINPIHYGKESRFINHSGEPNCKSIVMYNDGYYRLAIITERPIYAGEELTFDYGLTVWGKTRTFQ